MQTYQPEPSSQQLAVSKETLSSQGSLNEKCSARGLVSKPIPGASHSEQLQKRREFSPSTGVGFQNHIKVKQYNKTDPNEEGGPKVWWLHEVLPGCARQSRVR